MYTRAEAGRYKPGGHGGAAIKGDRLGGRRGLYMGATAAKGGGRAGMWASQPRAEQAGRQGQA